MSTTTVKASGSLPLLPRRLSPSRANDYATCPRMFKFKTIDKLPSPSSVASTAGNLSHLIFEKVFDLPREERTLEWALSSVESAWVELCTPAEGMPPHLVEAAAGYAALAPAGSVELEEIFTITRAAVEGWFKMEDPTRFDPTARELEVEAEFDGYRFGGILDRLDTWQVPNPGNPDGELLTRTSVSDYKSGSVPRDPSYTFKQQLALYAALLWEAKKVKVDFLRLLYVKTGSREEGLFTMRVTDTVLTNAIERMKSIRQGIEKSAETNTWDHKVGPLCAYCPFTKLCPEGAAEVERRTALKAERAAEDAARAAAQDAQAASA